MNLQDLRLKLIPLLSNTPFAGKAWFAGGCVRDYLLHPDKALQGDVDITVELAQGGIELAEHLHQLLGGNTPITHPEFLTASWLFEGQNLEFVATRKEIYPPRSRYPRVFPGTLYDDVLRRDFTINSLLMNVLTGGITDLSGLGMPDLQQGVLRSLGEPTAKFREDPLRLLRALRFALRLGFGIEPATLNAMRTQARYLNRLSSRLISLEITKTLQHIAPELLWHWLRELGWDRIEKITNALQQAERDRI